MFIHIQLTDGLSSFYASSQIRLGLHASYQIIDRRNLEIESHTGYFKFKSPIVDLGVLLLQLLLHQDLFLVFHLAVLRDGGVAVELQLVVDVLRLAWLVVSVLFEVVVGKGHLAELLLMGGGDYEANIA